MDGSNTFSYYWNFNLTDMSYQSEITYWLKNEEEGDINILSTPATKVPELGEEFYFSNDFDEEWARMVFPNLNDRFFPRKEEIVKGYFKVVSVKRYIAIRYVVSTASDVFGSEATSSSQKMPKSIKTETFEVFLEKVKE